MNRISEIAFIDGFVKKRLGREGPRGMIYSVHFLRFVAAVAVVVHHTLGTLGYAQITIGAAGVDLFFVISGVVIGLTSPKMSAAEFLLKRLIRVMPLYWIATAAALGWALQFAPWPPGEQLVRSLLLLPDLSATNWLPIYSPAWTLVFEWAFYLTFAALMFTGRYVKLATAGAIVPLALWLHDPLSSSLIVVFAPLVWEFVFGLAIAAIIEWRMAPGRIVGAILMASAGCWFAASVIAPDIFAGYTRTFIWGIPSALLLGGTIGFEPARLLRHRMAVLGGHASYAIYLFHLTLIEAISFAFFQAGSRAIEHPILAATAMIVLSLLVGFAAHALLERPGLDALRRMLLKPRAAAPLSAA